jgi:hypothetical protein
LYITFRNRLNRAVVGKVKIITPDGIEIEQGKYLFRFLPNEVKEISLSLSLKKRV